VRYVNYSYIRRLKVKHLGMKEVSRRTQTHGPYYMKAALKVQVTHGSTSRQHDAYAVNL